MSLRPAVVSFLLTACEGVATLQETQRPVDGTVTISGAPRVTTFRCADEVEATVPMACTLEVAHPRGTALECRVESSSGELLELGDCAGVQTAQVRLMTPGAATLKLLVRDPLGLETVRSFDVQVLLPPNQLPRVTRFEASRVRGVAPFSSTLSFEAADPDSATLTCELQPGGSIPCRGSSTVDVTGAGPTRVTFRARDGRGGTVERELTLTGVEPVGDVRIASVTFGQTVVTERLDLLEGKPALLVVGVVADRPGLVQQVEVIGRRAGAELGRLPVGAPMSPPTTLADVPQRPRVVLPATWLAPGLELEVRVDSKDMLPESNEDNNARRVTPTLTTRHVLHLTQVPVISAGVEASALDLEDTMVSQWPFVAVDSRTRAPYTTTTVPSGSDLAGWNTLLGEIGQVQGMDGSSRHYYGTVRARDWGIAGIAFLNATTAIGRDDNVGVASHELGHNFGRPHAPCGGAGGADGAYPYPNASIGSWGWNGQQLLNPAQWVDLMSYCSPGWVSDYTYRAALAAIRHGAAWGPTPPQAMQLEPSLVVSATVTGAEVVLHPLVAAHAARTQVSDSGWHVRLSSQKETKTFPLRASEASEGLSTHLLGIVEAMDDVRLVELLRGQVVIAREAARPVALEDLRVTRVDARRVRVRWDSNRAPWLSVAHLGVERTTLTLRASGGDVVVPHDGLAGGELELSASSGVATAVLRRPMPE